MQGWCEVLWLIKNYLNKCTFSYFSEKFSFRNFQIVGKIPSIKAENALCLFGIRCPEAVASLLARNDHFSCIYSWYLYSVNLSEVAAHNGMELRSAPHFQNDTQLCLYNCLCSTFSELYTTLSLQLSLLYIFRMRPN